METHPEETRDRLSTVAYSIDGRRHLLCAAHEVWSPESVVVSAAGKSFGKAPGRRARPPPYKSCSLFREATGWRRGARNALCATGIKAKRVPAHDDTQPEVVSRLSTREVAHTVSAIVRPQCDVHARKVLNLVQWYSIAEKPEAE